MRTANTLLVGALAAGIGYLLGLPLYPLLTPAIVLSLLSVAGVDLNVPAPVRDLAFLILGISIGSGMDSEAVASILSWPVVFVLLSIMLLASIVFGKWLLVHHFAFDSRSAVLAASPGHLGYVVSLGIDHNCDVTRITVLQTLRLLLMTVSVPLIAGIYGIDVGTALVFPGAIQSMPIFAILFLVSGAVGWLLLRLSVPAAFLIGGMAVSAIGHASDLTPGTVPSWLLIPSFVVLGCLIGSRFSGISLRQLLAAMGAGVVTTLVSAAFACLFAWLASHVIEMPWLHLLFAFAPGGLETMIILGAFFGANPGFLAAAHVVRLLILSFMVPAFLAWVTRREAI